MPDTNRRYRKLKLTEPTLQLDPDYLATAYAILSGRAHYGSTYVIFKQQNLLKDPHRFMDELPPVEKMLILLRCGWPMTTVSKLLGIDYQTIQLRIKKYIEETPGGPFTPENVPLQYFDDKIRHRRVWDGIQEYTVDRKTGLRQFSIE